ncbi:MAG: type II toxin-antitoxin system RelE/ParE family toxin [Christensenellaceae bacterium]|jgi:mRNA interferase RelE/StbE|nr:type II toxin-antitoxin system RelE/ParE family toxin [Christensenellaceae bacterium]
MKYTVDYSKRAEKWFSKANKNVAKMLYSWIGKNLVDTTNPFQHGKALTADLAGFWRYRVGDYRILCEIQQDKLTIYVVEVGHRREVYE